MKKETKTVKPKKVDEVKILQEIVDSLMDLMATKSKTQVSKEEGSDNLIVDIDAGDETGLLIGHRGDTINSLQMILGLSLRQKIGEWKRVVVNVGDWREKQDDYLKNLAKDISQKVIDSGEPQPLYNLTPAQRRIIHMELSENEKVATESIGEGEERYLVVKPK